MEKHFNQFLAIDHGQGGFYFFCHGRHGLIYLFQSLRPFDGSILNHIQHIEHPVLPILFFGHAAQILVIRGLVLYDVLAQVNGRNAKQSAQFKIEQKQYSARSAVSVCKRVNGLKLIVHQCQFHQRVKGFVLVDELFQIAHF